MHMDSQAWNASSRRRLASAGYCIHISGGWTWNSQRGTSGATLGVETTMARQYYNTKNAALGENGSVQSDQLVRTAVTAVRLCICLCCTKVSQTAGIILREEGSRRDAICYIQGETNCYLSALPTRKAATILLIQEYQQLRKRVLVDGTIGHCEEAVCAFETALCQNPAARNLGFFEPGLYSYACLSNPEIMSGQEGQ